MVEPTQQVANTEPQQAPQGEPQTPQGTEPQQVQSTVEPQGQPQVTEPTEDLSKVDLSQATPEQLAEIQKGYMRNSDYTQKTQELADQRKELTDYDALIQKPEFIQWASNKQAQTQQTQPPQTQEAEDEKVANMSESERVQYYVQKQMAPIAQSYYQDKQRMEDKELSTKYGDTFNTFVPKITQMQQAIAKQPYLYREEAFKVLDYETAQKRAFESGRQEGLKGIQQRQNANVVQETGIPSTTQREIIRGPGAINKIWDRANKEGRTA